MNPAAQNPPPELREKVLESATRAFLSRPYEQVRVEDIVADAGVAKGLAFYYFKSKRGLYLAVVQQLMVQLVERTTPDLRLSPRRRQHAAVGSFVEWVQTIDGIEIILASWPIDDSQAAAVMTQAAEVIMEQTVAAMSDISGGPGTDDELPRALLSRSILGWLAYVRIVTADWLLNRDMSPDQLRDLLVGALDGVVVAARKVAAEAR